MQSYASRIATLLIAAIFGLAGLSADAGSLNVINGAKYVGDYGLEVLISDANPTYVEDDSPVSEPHYRVRFYLRPDLVVMGSGNEFNLFTATMDGGSGPTFRAMLFFDGTEHRVRVAARTDGGTETALVTSDPLEVGWYAVEIDWSAASAVGANDGSLDWWLNGAAQTGISGVDNDTLSVDAVRWGATYGIDAGTSGSLYLDSFESRREGAIGLLTVFTDVPEGPFQPWVLAMYNTGVTKGCAAGLFCFNNSTSRKEMAVFTLRAIEGPDYTPPACVVPPFNDVPCSSPFAPWIAEFAARGITAGCGGGNFCPDAIVSRGQMAVFMLKAIEGSGYTPPACVTPPFDDVPCSHPFAAWIGEFATRGITAGCGGGNYCPEGPVIRGQMAVFIGKAFSLPVPTLP